MSIKDFLEIVSMAIIAGLGAVGICEIFLRLEKKGIISLQKN